MKWWQWPLMIAGAILASLVLMVFIPVMMIADLCTWRKK